MSHRHGRRGHAGLRSGAGAAVSQGEPGRPAAHGAAVEPPDEDDCVEVLASDEELDKKVKEEGQKVRYRRAMLSQNLERMLLSARFLMGYSIPEDLSSIRVPCAVMTASSDKLHGMEKILDIVQRIPGAEMIEVPSNQYAHEADVLKEIREFQSSV